MLTIIIFEERTNQLKMNMMFLAFGNEEVLYNNKRISPGIPQSNITHCENKHHVHQIIWRSISSLRTSLN